MENLRRHNDSLYYNRLVKEFSGYPWVPWRHQFYLIKNWFKDKGWFLRNPVVLKWKPGRCWNCVRRARWRVPIYLFKSYPIHKKITKTNIKTSLFVQNSIMPRHFWWFLGLKIVYIIEELCVCRKLCYAVREVLEILI